MKNSLIPKHQHTWSPLVERNSSTYVARPVVIQREATEQEKATWEQSLHKGMKKVNGKWYPVKNEQIKADTRTEKQRKEEDAEGRAKYNDTKRKEQARKINNGIMTVGALGALAAAQATPVGPYLDAAFAAHGAYGLAKQADEGTLGANLETAGHTLEMLPLGIKGGVGLWNRFGKNVYLNFKYPVYKIKPDGTTSRVWLPATLNGTEINTNPFSLTQALPLQLLLGYTPESLKQYLGLSLATGNSSSGAPLFSEYVKSPLTYLLQMLSRYPLATFTWNNLYPSFTPNGNGPIRYVGTTKMTPFVKRLIDINLERWQSPMFKTPEYKYISLPSGSNIIKSWDIVKDRIKDLDISLYVPESQTTVTGFVGGGSDKVNVRLYPTRNKTMSFTMLHEGYSHPTDLVAKETELTVKGKNVKLSTLYNLLASPNDIYGFLAVRDNITGSSLTGEEARAMANELKLGILGRIAKEYNIPVNEVTDDMIKNGVVKYINSPEKLKQLFKSSGSKYTHDYAKLLDLGTKEQNEHYLQRWLLALKHLPEIATATYLTNNND